MLKLISMRKDELIKIKNLANYGNKEAINTLYDFYCDNEEYEKGFLLLKAQEKYLDNEALRKLAYAYLHGFGVEHSINEAKKYYQIAYENGDPVSGYNLALLLMKQKDYLNAISYLSYGVYQNHLRSISLLAEIYANGLGVDRNSEIAIGLYRKLLDNGDYLINDKIGKIYYQDGDYVEAVKYFTNGAKKLDPEALYHLGICYSKGQGLPMDTSKAIYYYELGAAQNHTKCIKNLIFHYEKGVGVMINTRKVEIYKNKLAVIQG